ncbi:MAG: NAD(+) synthase [Desulfobacterales bacterium]|nr:MAG: NAD(+) synthase [Desulfobacterales bacterium]
MAHPFFSLYHQEFLRAAVAVPAVRLSAPLANTEHMLALARQAADDGCALVLFPELGVTAYSNDDLFHQQALLDAADAALGRITEASRRLEPLLIAGAPLRAAGALFNCGIVFHQGRILGAVPKSYLPSYREFYEKRQFVPADRNITGEAVIAGQRVPFGTDLLFRDEAIPGFRLGLEICEDLWAPIPPSSYAAMAGALILCNLSASNITVGKADTRRNLCAGLSERLIAAYLYSAAGPGESTTDLAWDGYALIHEAGERLSESGRFAQGSQLITADIDLARLRQERLRSTSFNDAVIHHRERVSRFREIPFRFSPPASPVPLRRKLERFPFVPSDIRRRDERCYEAYHIQVHGLVQRMRTSGIHRLVVGISGGLDSTQALIVAARAMDELGISRREIRAYTMPGFATSEKTRTNAFRLMDALDVSAGELDIRPSCRRMLADIGHPCSRGEAVYDITFENVQAGDRTSHLFRLANFHGALVLGTGDLSELALGWATYGVGDHMSHYNVNASVPKTLVQHLIRWAAARNLFGDAASSVLRDILGTEISPELVPGTEAGNGPSQKSEDKIGPYELQDFHLYWITRYGFTPSRTAFLAWNAWSDREKGDWSDLISEEWRNQYSLEEIRHWLRIFLYRFFQISQFKRTAAPNGPKVGSGGALSPRGDWRAPADGNAEIWLAELEAGVPAGDGLLHH